MQGREELRPHLQPGAPLSGSVPRGGRQPLACSGNRRVYAFPMTKGTGKQGLSLPAAVLKGPGAQEHPALPSARLRGRSPGGRSTRGSLRAGSGRQRGRAARGPRAVAAQRGAGGARRGARENRQAPSHSLSLSLSFLSVPLCRSACYIPPFLHIFLLGFRVHSLEIRFTVK